MWVLGRPISFAIPPATGPGRGTMARMQFGRSYEEFEVGAVYKHWPGKTVTEYDDHLFCLLTMNHHPLHPVSYTHLTLPTNREV